MCCSIRACWRPRSHEAPSGQRPQEPLASISRFLSRANATSPIASHRRAHPSEPSPSPAATFVAAPAKASSSSEHARVSRGSQFLHPIVRSSKSRNLFGTNLRGNPRVGVLIASVDCRRVQIADLSSCHDDDYEVHTFLSNRLQIDIEISHFHALGFPDSPCRALIHANRCRT